MRSYHKTVPPRSPLRKILFIFFLFAAPAAFTQFHSRLNADNNSIASYIEISKTFEDNQPDSAVDYCSRGMRLAEKRNDLKGQALLLLQLGQINNIHHHLDLARKFTNEALSIFRTLHDWKDIAMAYDELGLMDGQANMDAANSDFNQSMKFYEDTRDSMGIAATYHSQGTVYEEKGDAEKALTYYLRALIQYEHRSMKTDDYFILLQQISRLYAQKGDRLAALHYLEEGVHTSNDPLFKDTEITMLEEEGDIMEASGQDTHALTCYKKELDAAKTSNNLEGQAKALADIASVLKKDNAGKSLEYLKKALAIAQQLSQPALKASIYDALAGVYQQQKDYKEAMLALEEHNRLLDSLMLSQKNRDISALDTSYQLEASWQQIDALQEVNKKEKTKLNLVLGIIGLVIIALIVLWAYLRRIKRLNAELNESNHVRDTLFSIMGHDLKGPAGNAVQLLEIIETAGLPEEQKKKMLSELKKQSIASFDLLNALFEWGKAQLHGVDVSPETFDTKSLIQKNLSLLAPLAARKNIAITDNTPAGLQVHTDPNHFDFIVRNLLSNAIKFTHDQGHIDIQAATIHAADGTEVIYSVKDSGIGISKAKQETFLKTNLPVSFGTKGEKGSGLGLLLIKEFTKANKGRLWLESKEGEGSTFYFAFPS